MLAITPVARRAIESLLDREEGPGRIGGIRISRHWSLRGGAGGLVFTLESLPGSGDEVIVQQGARVFLAPEAAPLLADMVLDVIVEATSVEFRISGR